MFLYRKPIQVALCLLFIGTLVACEPEIRITRQSFEDLRRMADDNPAPSSRDRQAKDQQFGPWAIPLAYYTGATRSRQAEALKRRLEIEFNMTELWIEHGQQTDVLFTGSFQTPQDPAARRMLRQVQAMEIDGVRHFELSELTVVRGPAGGELDDPLNLRQHHGMYSLQIAFFDSSYPGDRHVAAREYARQLREKGEQAFYYHGDHRSLVTVGLFNHTQAFETVPNPNMPNSMVEAYSKTVRELQERFPHNLANGYTLIQRQGEQASEQTSALVRVF